MMKPETKLIKDLLKKMNAKQVKVRVKDGVRVCANADDSIIYINPEMYVNRDVENLDMIWNYYMSENFKIEVDVATFVILHEIGHILTLSHLSPLELNQYLWDYNRKCYELQQLATEKQRVKAYRNIAVEKMADTKAYELYNTYTKEIKEFDKKMVELIKASN